MFESLTYIANPKELNYMRIVFQPAVAAASTDYFYLYIPVVDQEGNQLFAEDLGTGLTSGSNIPCSYRLTKPAQTAFTVTCQLTHGSKSAQTHARIKITGTWTTLATNVIYTFDMDTFFTPAAPTDTLHVQTIFEHFTSGGTIIENAICYDFSLKTFTYDVTAFTNIPTHSTNIAEDTGVT